MRRIILIGLSLLACVLVSSRSAAAAGGIADHAHILKPDTISQAQSIIDQIKTRENHDVRIETYSAIPDTLKSQYSPENKTQFFDNWATQIGKENSISGIVVLLCMDPGHVQIGVGNETRRRAFTLSDRDEVRNELVKSFGQKNYDAGILDALRTIQSRMTTNMAGSNPNGAPAAGNSSSSGSSSSIPGPIGSSGSHGIGTGVGGMFCVIVGAIIVLMLLVRMFNRNRGGSGPGYGGAPPQGGYPPGYVGGAGYPPQGYGGVGGGGGGGFGRGLLGGLLGGAIGSWGYDKLSHPNQNNPAGGYIPPNAGNAGTNDVDTSYSSSGGDFGTPDSGGGGADFGPSDAGGGGDFGGGGGDAGGGGGGDSGGGGGDF